MPNLPAVDEWIRGILSGSELSMDRRAEIADEWRDHLRERIAAKIATGVIREDAVRTALTKFGDPARLRRQLRRGQRARDLRDALAKTRPIAAWTIGGALCAAVGAAIFLPGPPSSVYRLASGCVLFVVFFLPTLVFAFVAGFLELRVKRSQPIDEFHPVRSLARWTAVVAGFLAAILLSAPVAVGLIAYFAQGNAFLSCLHPDPEVMYGAPWLIWRNIAVAACEFPVRSFVIPPIMILTGAVAITFYERSRCVDTTAGAADS